MEVPTVPTPPASGSRSGTPRGTPRDSARRLELDSLLHKVRSEWPALLKQNPEAMAALRDAIRSDEVLAAGLADGFLAHRTLVSLRRRRSRFVGASLLPHTARIVQRRMLAADYAAEPFEAALLVVRADGMRRLSHDVHASLIKIEDYKRQLGALFAGLLSAVGACGGDVIRFDGELMFVLWPVLEGESESLEQAVASAAACARSLRGHQNIQLRTSLGCGTVRGLHVGSEDGHKAFVLAGPIVGSCTDALARAEPGEVVASAAVFAALAAPEGDAVEGAEGLLRLTGLGADDAFEPVAPQAVETAHLDLSMYVSPMATAEAGLREELLLSVHAAGADMDLQQVFALTQSTLAGMGGQLWQCVATAAGATLKGSFALVTHSDCSSALSAGALVVSRLAEAGVAATVGVTLGTVYCGVLGVPETRCEFAMLGRSEELAEQLAGSATNEGLLCDERVQQHCLNSWLFEERESVEPEGYTHPVQIFKPISGGDEPAVALPPVQAVSELDLEGMLATDDPTVRGAALLLRGEVEEGRALLAEVNSAAACTWALGAGAAVMADELFAAVPPLTEAPSTVQRAARVGFLSAASPEVNDASDAELVKVGYYRGEPEGWKLIFRNEFAAALELVDGALLKPFTVVSGEARLQAIRAVALAGLKRNSHALAAERVATQEFERLGMLLPAARLEAELVRLGVGTASRKYEALQATVRRPKLYMEPRSGLFPS